MKNYTETLQRKRMDNINEMKNYTETLQRKRMENIRVIQKLLKNCKI